VTEVHNADIRDRGSGSRFDVLIFQTKITEIHRRIQHAL